MKDFNDLVFEAHVNVACGFNTQATMNFDNGYGVSVVTGSSAYSHDDAPYEVAILKDKEITYSTPITDDVIGYNTAINVSEVMKQVQEL